MMQIEIVNLNDLVKKEHHYRKLLAIIGFQLLVFNGRFCWAYKNFGKKYRSYQKQSRAMVEIASNFESGLSNIFNNISI
jgi:hypothetical protein